MPTNFPGLFSALVFVTMTLGLGAQTIRYVPSPGLPTIQAAINASAAGDIVQVAAGTYPGGLSITKKITIEGAGNGVTIIDAAGAGRCMRIDVASYVSVSIRKLEVRNGATNPMNYGTGGGIALYRTGYWLAPGRAVLKLEDVAIRDCTAHYGAGIYAAASTRLELVNCQFIGNGLTLNSLGAGSGGGLFAYGEVDAQGCDFIANVVKGSNFSSDRAGAAFIAQASAVSFSACRFVGNESGEGGVIVAVPTNATTPGSVKIDRSEFSDNSSFGGASAIMVGDLQPSALTVEISNCLFTANQMAGFSATVLKVRAQDVTVTSCSFSGNNVGDITNELVAIDASNSLQVRNTIADGNGRDFLKLAVSPGATGSVSHCLLGNASFGMIPGIVMGPGLMEFIGAGFRDPQGGDFRLLPGSPAVDAGQMQLGDSPLDLEGLPRVQGAVTDLGCFELQPGEEDPGLHWRGSIADLMGGFADVLEVDGSAGGISRRVFTTPGVTSSISLDAAPGMMGGNFVIWGRIGLPTAVEAFSIPFAEGTMAFAPHAVATGNASLFTLSSSVFQNAFFYAPSAPWQYQGPALPFPITITLQGLIETGNGDIRVTNAIAIHNS